MAEKFKRIIDGTDFLAFQIGTIDVSQLPSISLVSFDNSDSITVSNEWISTHKPSRDDWIVQGIEDRSGGFYLVRNSAFYSSYAPIYKIGNSQENKKVYTQKEALELATKKADEKLIDLANKLTAMIGSVVAGVKWKDGVLTITSDDKNSGDFSWALRNLKTGSFLARHAWKGKDEYIFIATPSVKVNVRVSPTALSLEDASKALGFPVLDRVFCKKTADNKIVPGWVASQTDMLETDWYMI